jgi:hypothetical protein
VGVDFGRPPFAVRPDGCLIATVDEDDGSTLDLWTVVT